MILKLDVTCRRCGRHIVGRRSHAKFCSPYCQRAATWDRKTMIYQTDSEERRRHSARTKVGWAVRMGRIQRQPCEICGHDQAEAHHDDYTKPFEIRWLCKRHHKLLHIRGEAA